MKTKYQNGDDVQMVIKTQKQSQTGLFNNQRLLMIKAGIVSYFSSIPKKFSGSSRAIQMSGQVPKFTIAANEISKIELKGLQLSILVLKSKLISKDQFGQMVKGIKNIPQNHGKSKSDGGGYEQWIFKSEDEESLLEFYQLINLFRTNDPAFQPHLSEMVQSFQNKKTPRKTMDPIMSQAPYIQNRRSQVPQSKNPQFAIQKDEQKPNLPPPIAPQQQVEDILKQNYPQNHLKKTESNEIKIEEGQQDNEQQRLNLVKDKINQNNVPRMSIIEQKPGQDKASQISKALNINRPILIQVFKTFDEQKQIKIEEKKDQQLQRQPQQQKQQPKIVELKSVPQKEIPQYKQPVKNENKIQKQQNHSFLNPSFFDAQSRIQFEIKQQKKIKVNQMLKSALLLHKNDFKSMAQSLKIPVQELIQFLKVNKPQEEDSWQFIQNELARIVVDKQNELGQLKSLNLSNNLIDKYHSLGDFYVNSGLKSYQLLEGEVSFDNFEEDFEQQNIIVQWLKSQVSKQVSKSFSTKVFNKFQSKISLRKIVFDQKQIISIKGSWVLNKGGFLLQFLAYLSLQKIVKQLMEKEKGKFEIDCAQVCYIKSKEYEALVRQLRVSNSYYPLKSIKALQFMSKSKGIKYFQKSFPQFSINVQILKSQDIYKFHLERTSVESFQITAIENQLKKLYFTIDSELEIFFGTNQYQNIQRNCIAKLKKIQNQNKKIDQSSLIDIVSTASSNIQIATIFKWLGARMSPNNKIIFETTMIKLGNHQFGSQYSLIKKTRKKGNYQHSYLLSKRLMITPTQNFIAVYLQLVEMMILEKGQLHRAVPILLKISQFLSEFQVQRYSVYLALMKSYIRLHQIQNFIKTLQNCRLFLRKMFQENALVFDFPFYRTIIALNTFQNSQSGIKMSQKLIQTVLNTQSLPQQVKQKFVSKLFWDKCNIYINTLEYAKAYEICNNQLQLLQSTQGCLQGYWIQGVVILSKSWLQIKTVSPLNSANLQKRIQRAISLSLSLELFEIAFLLRGFGQKVLQKCKQLHLPRYLQNQAAFQQAKIQLNSAREQMLELIVQIQ